IYMIEHFLAIPSITVSPDTLDFGTVFIGFPDTLSVNVTNTGFAPLQITGISVAGVGFTANTSVFTLEPGETHLIDVALAATSIQAYTGSLTITSNDPDIPTVTVVLRGEGILAPAIEVTPTTLSAALFTGGQETQVVQISNTGDSDLIYSLTPEYEGVQGVSIELLGNVDYPQDASDVWGYSAPDGTELAIIGLSTGVSFVEVSTDPAQLTEVAFIEGPSSIWRDIKTYSHYAYIVTEGGGGLQIVDLADPQHPILAATYVASFYHAHNLFIDEAGFAYIVGSDAANGGLHILDLTDPVNPVVAGNWSDRYVHDVFVRNNTAYAADIYRGTLDIIDVTIKSNPTLIASTITSGFFTHNVWLTDDGNYALTTDEVFGGYVDIYDIRDLNSITRVAQYRLDPNHIPHNVFVKGNLAYLSAYVDGVVILDISDPTNPVAVAQFDTFEGDGFYDGAWGVYPFARNNLIYVSDIQSGLYVLEVHGWLGTSPDSGTVAAGSSVDVSVTFDASGLSGGSYDANMVIASNDPVNPEIIVAVSLAVTGAPDIAVSADTLDFGQVFVNAATTLELAVKNDGSDPLYITGVVADPIVYTVIPPVANIDPTETDTFLVTLAPTSLGDYPGTLTFTSNDPDEETLVIILQGQGILPPIIAVSPDSLGADLFTGDTLVQQLTIDNSAGGSDLVYEILVEAVELGLAPSATKPGLAPSQAHTTVSPRSSSLADLLGDRFRSRHRGKLGVRQRAKSVQGTPAGPAASEVWRLLYTDPQEFGPGFDVQHVYGQVTPEEILFRLEGYAPLTDSIFGIIAIDADQDTLTGLNIDAVTDYGWQLGIDYLLVTFHLYSELLQYVSYNGDWDFEFVDIPTSQIVEIGSSDIILGVGRDPFVGLPALNFAVEMISELIEMVPDQGQGNITFPLSPPWLRLGTQAGVVQAGTQADVSVVFDATGLFGGEYSAAIQILSNDPATPQLTVPAHLSVTGAADVATPIDSVDFDVAFVGFIDSTIFILENIGTDLLTVSGITSGSGELTISQVTLSIPPLASDTITLYLLAGNTGAYSTMLTISSNDPDTPELLVPVSADVLLAPDIHVTPTEFTLAVHPDSAHSELLTLYNNGGSELSYAVSIAYPDDGLSKGQATYDEGGPDAFGYRWKDSNEPGGPAFDWIDAMGGSLASLSDDSYVTGISLGFDFSYYGQQYSSVNIMSNGWISFTDFDYWFPNQVPDSDQVPDSARYYTGVIAPFAGDLYPPGGQVLYHSMGSEPNRVFVVEFNGVPWCCSGPPYMTFEVILYEAGDKIRFQYFDLQGQTPWAIGIASPDNSTGLGNGGSGITYIDPAIVGDNYALEFSARTEWLLVEPTAGSVAAGDSVNIAITTDISELDLGSYSAQILVTSNDPDEGQVAVPVALTVTLEVAAGLGLPQSFALHQNYPNPFNPTTTLRFDLPAATHVRIVIYDLLGREVVHLVNGRLEAGYHGLIWNGRDTRGREVPTSIYIAHLMTPGYTKSIKMVLLK
ncbi:MAG: choice-of-anchor B family protein, partial [Candidatus Marinimicrobia bacterium]|nr:choice-of-anchor B family protein [Candidatus Neomarinimicrobiota bacterium]